MDKSQESSLLPQIYVPHNQPRELQFNILKSAVLEEYNDSSEAESEEALPQRKFLQGQSLPLSKILEKSPFQKKINQHQSKKTELQLNEQPKGRKPPKGIKMEDLYIRSGSQKRRIKSPHRQLKMRPRSCASQELENNQQPQLEDISNSLSQLKIDYNKVKQERKSYKTRNLQLETLINQLYEDLQEQQSEIDKIVAGKATAKPEFWQQSITLALKRQLRDERTMYKLLVEDYEKLKEHIKATSIEELNTEIDTYKKECKRLHKMLKRELKRNKRNRAGLSQDVKALLHSVLVVEDRHKVANLIAQQEIELKEANKQVHKLKSELQEAISTINRQEATKYKFQTDLSNKQAFLVQAKSEQIKMLQEQLSTELFKSKSIEDKLNAKIQELTQKNTEQFDHIQKLKNQKSSLNPETSPIRNSRLVSQTLFQKLRMNLEKDKVAEAEPTQLQEVIEEQSQLVQNEQIRESSIFSLDHSANNRDLSELQIKIQHSSDTPVISSTELLCRGIRHFKAIIQQDEQPKSDADQSFYNAYSLQIKNLLKILQEQSLNADVLTQLMMKKIELSTDSSLEEQIRVCINNWSQSAEEMQVCFIVLKFVVPSLVADTISLPNVYTLMQSAIPLVEHQSNSVRKSIALTETSDGKRNIVVENGSYKTVIPQLQFSPAASINYRAQLQAIVQPKATVEIVKLQELQQNFEVAEELKTEQLRSLTMTQKSSENSFLNNYEADRIKLYQPSTLSEQKKSLSEAQQSHLNSYDGPSLPGQLSNDSNTMEEQKSITEDEMLDIAEQILNYLAQSLVNNGWSVSDVFGQPEEIIKIIPEYQGETNIKVLTQYHFIGRIHQIGLQNLTQLQLACLMHVLGKPEFEGSVRYNELELLMENFGVRKSKEQGILESPTKIREEILASETITNVNQQSEVVSEGVVFIDDTSQNIEIKINQEMSQGEHNSIQSQKTSSNAQMKNMVKQEAVSSYSQARSGFQGHNSTPFDQSFISNQQLKVLPFEFNENIRAAQNLLLNVHKKISMESATVEIISNTEPENVQASDDFVKKEEEATPFFPKLLLKTSQLKKQTFPSYQNSSHSILTLDEFHRKNEMSPVQDLVPEEPRHESLKDSRIKFRQQIVKNLASPIVELMKDVLLRTNQSDLIQMLEKHGYKQQVKSKTKSSETSIIPQASFLTLMYGLTPKRLSEQDLTQLSECVQLTPKFNYLFSIYLLKVLIQEIDEKVVGVSRNRRQSSVGSAFGIQSSQNTFT